MGGVVFITVDQGQKLTVNLKKKSVDVNTNAENPLNIPILLDVRLNGGEMRIVSYPRMPPIDNNLHYRDRITNITKSGTYLLTWSDEWAIELIEV